MKNTKNNWTLLVVGLVFAVVVYLLIGASTAQAGSSGDNTSPSVAAPGPGQKKVVLKNLGMT